MFEQLTFRQIRDLRNQHAPDLGINDFSQFLNQATRTPIAQMGVGNKFEIGVKTADTAIDDFLAQHASGAQDWLGDAGAWLFRKAKLDEQFGRQVGEESLRGVVDFLPAIGGMLAGGAIGLAGGPAGAIAGATYGGLAGTSLLGSMNAFSKTDQMAPTLFAAGMPFAAGPIAGTGARIAHALTRGSGLGASALGRALGVVGGSTMQHGDEMIRIAHRMGDRIVGAVAGEAAINVAAMAGEGVVNYASTGDWTNPFTKENVLANMIDPTIIFGVAELVAPTKISSRRIVPVDNLADGTRFANAQIESAQNEIVPASSVRGDNIRDIQLAYNAEKRRINQITDDTIRETQLIKLEEQRLSAFEKVKGDNVVQVDTLFGQKYRKTETPVTEKEVSDDGTVFEREVTPEDVVTDWTDANGEIIMSADERISQMRQQGYSETEIVRAERLHQSPSARTEEDLVQQVEDANVLREEFGDAGPLLDAELQSMFEDAIEEAADANEAVEIVSERIKSSTAKELTKGKIEKRSETQIKVDKDLEELKKGFVLNEEKQYDDLFNRYYDEIPRKSVGTQYRVKTAFVRWMREERRRYSENPGEGFRKFEEILQKLTSTELRQEVAAWAGEKGGQKALQVGDKPGDQEAMSWLSEKEVSGDPVDQEAFKVYVEEYSTWGDVNHPRSILYAINAYKRWDDLRKEGKLLKGPKGVNGPPKDLAEELEILRAGIKRIKTVLKIHRTLGAQKVKLNAESNINAKYATEEVAQKQIALLSAKYPDINFWTEWYKPKAGEEPRRIIRWASREVDGLNEFMAGEVNKFSNVQLEGFERAAEFASVIVAEPMDNSVDSRQAAEVNEQLTKEALDKIAATVVRKEPEEEEDFSPIVDQANTLLGNLGSDKEISGNDLKDIADQIAEALREVVPKSVKARVYRDGLKNLRKEILETVSAINNVPSNIIQFKDLISSEAFKPYWGFIEANKSKDPLEKEVFGEEIGYNKHTVAKNLLQSIQDEDINELKRWVARAVGFDVSNEAHQKFLNQLSKYNRNEPYYENDRNAIELAEAERLFHQRVGEAGEGTRASLEAFANNIDGQKLADVNKVIEDVVERSSTLAIVNVGRDSYGLGAGVEHRVFEHPFDNNKVLKFANYNHTMFKAEDLGRYFKALRLRNMLLGMDVKLVGFYKLLGKVYAPVTEITRVPQEVFDFNDTNFPTNTELTENWPVGLVDTLEAMPRLRGARNRYKKYLLDRHMESLGFVESPNDSNPTYVSKYDPRLGVRDLHQGNYGIGPDHKVHIWDGDFFTTAPDADTDSLATMHVDKLREENQPDEAASDKHPMAGQSKLIGGAEWVFNDSGRLMPKNKLAKKAVQGPHGQADRDDNGWLLQNQVVENLNDATETSKASAELLHHELDDGSIPKSDQQFLENFFGDELDDPNQPLRDGSERIVGFGEDLEMRFQDYEKATSRIAKQAIQDELAKMHGYSKKLYHGSVYRFDTFSDHNQSGFNLGFHFGDKEQASHANFARGEDDVRQYYVRANNSLRLEDQGMWEPQKVKRQLDKNQIPTPDYDKVNVVANKLAREDAAKWTLLGLNANKQFMPDVDEGLYIIQNKETGELVDTLARYADYIKNIQEAPLSPPLYHEAFEVLSGLEREFPMLFKVFKFYGLETFQRKALIRDLEAAGYDSIVYKNKYEPAGYDKANEPIHKDSYIVFNENSIKLASIDNVDLVTGEPISIRDRFAADTDNVRYFSDEDVKDVYDAVLKNLIAQFDRIRADEETVIGAGDRFEAAYLYNRARGRAISRLRDALNYGTVLPGFVNSLHMQTVHDAILDFTQNYVQNYASYLIEGQLSYLANQIEIEDVKFAHPTRGTRGLTKVEWSAIKDKDDEFDPRTLDETYYALDEVGFHVANGWAALADIDNAFMFGKTESPDSDEIARVSSTDKTKIQFQFRGVLRKAILLNNGVPVTPQDLGLSRQRFDSVLSGIESRGGIQQMLDYYTESIKAWAKGTDMENVFNRLVGMGVDNLSHKIESVPDESRVVIKAVNKATGEPDGEIVLHRQGPKEYTIYSMDARPNGTLLYSAANLWLKNNGYKDLNPPELTDINVARKVSNILSSLLKTGTSKHLNSNSQLPFDFARNTVDDIAATALAELNNVRHYFPEIRELTYDFEKMVVMSEGKPLYQQDLLALVTSNNRNPKLTGVGVATLERALITQKLADSAVDMTYGHIIKSIERTVKLPHSLLYSGKPAPIDQFRQVRNMKKLVSGILERKGMSKEAIDKGMPVFKTLLDFYGVDDNVRFFEILNESVRGAATIEGPLRKLFLSGRKLDELDDQGKLDALAVVGGHELGHLVEQLYKEGHLKDTAHQWFKEFEQWSEKSNVNDIRFAMEMALEMLPKRFRTAEVVGHALKQAENPEEARANLMSLWTLSQTSKPNLFVLNLMPRPVRQLFRVLTDFARSVYGALKGGLSVNGEFMRRTDIRRRMDQMVKLSHEFKEAHARASEFEAEAKKLAYMGDEKSRLAAMEEMEKIFSLGGITEAVDLTQSRSAEKLAGFGEVGDPLPEDNRGLVRQSFDAVINQFDQLANMVPTLKGLNTVLHNFAGGTRASIKQTTGGITGEIDSNGMPRFSTREGRLDFERVRDRPMLNKIASDWMRAMQTAERNNGSKKMGRILKSDDLKVTNPSIWNAWNKLSTKDKRAVENTIFRLQSGMMTFQHVEVRKAMKSGNVAILKSLIASRNPDLYKAAPAIADGIYSAIEALDTSTNPARQVKAQQMIAKYATMLDVDLFREVYDLAEKQYDSYNELFAQFADHPEFFSEMRFGKHFLHWIDTDGKTGGLAFDNLEDMRAYARKLETRGVDPTTINKESVKRGVPHMVGEDKLVKVLKEYDERNRDMVDTMNISDSDKARLKGVFDYGNQFIRELHGQDLVRQGRNRGFKHGREDLDMIQTQFAYFNAATRALHKKILNSEIQYELSNPELKNAKVQAHMPIVMEHLENFMRPDTELGTKIAYGNAAYFLGLNFSSHLIELAQPMFSYVPELQARGVGYVDAMRMIHEAQLEVGSFTARHIPTQIKRTAKQLIPLKILQGEDDNAKWTDPEISDLMKYGNQQGWISLAHASDVTHIDLATNVDLTELTGRNGNKATDSLVQKGLTPARLFAKYSMKIYQQFTEFNTRVALIAGYKLARNQGMSKLQATEYAGEFARTVTFSGGKATRPTKLFGGEGNFRTLGQAAYSLSGYTFGMLSMMRRYAETAFNKKQYPGLTEVDRKRARKALLTMVSTQFLGAGLVGMPFAAAAMQMLEKLTGIEIEKEVREGLAEFFEEDKVHGGGLMSDIIMHGAANAMIGRTVPGAPDIGSRFAIGGILGVNAYDGYSMADMMGPTASVVENVAKGATKLVRDRNPSGAFQDVMPVAFKKLIDMHRNDWEFKDQNAGLLVKSNTPEKVAYALGFTPQKVKDMKNYARLHRRHEEHVRREDVAKHDQLAAVYMDDPLQAQWLLQQEAAKDPEVQFFKDRGDELSAQEATIKAYKAGAQKMAERVERKVFARDPRREGYFKSTAGSDALLNAMGQAGQVSETARLQIRNQVMQSLGLPGVTQTSVMTRAMLVDQIMQQNPNMPRPQAAALAQKYLLRNPALRRALSGGLPELQLQSQSVL